MKHTLQQNNNDNQWFRGKGDPSFALDWNHSLKPYSATVVKGSCSQSKLQKSMEEFMRSLKDYSLEETEYIISELIKEERGMHAMHYHCIPQIDVWVAAGCVSLVFVPNREKQKRRMNRLRWEWIWKREKRLHTVKESAGGCMAAHRRGSWLLCCYWTNLTDFLLRRKQNSTPEFGGKKERRLRQTVGTIIIIIIILCSRSWGTHRHFESWFYSIHVAFPLKWSQIVCQELGMMSQRRWQSLPSAGVVVAYFPRRLVISIADCCKSWTGVVK